MMLRSAQLWSSPRTPTIRSGLVSKPTQRTTASSPLNAPLQCRRRPYCFCVSIRTECARRDRLAARGAFRGASRACVAVCYYPVSYSGAPKAHSAAADLTCNSCMSALRRCTGDAHSTAVQISVSGDHMHQTLQSDGSDPHL